MQEGADRNIRRQEHIVTTGYGSISEETRWFLSK